jgi:hypothetical protein
MYQCYLRPCHHGMTRPRAEDGADGLLIWKVAANADGSEGLVLHFGGGRGLATHRKRKLVRNWYTG